MDQATALRAPRLTDNRLDTEQLVDVAAMRDGGAECPAEQRSCHCEYQHVWIHIEAPLLSEQLTAPGGAR